MRVGNKGVCVLTLVTLMATVALAARVRPGGDPRPDRVIWADPFDNYSQWAWDNQSNPAYSTGTLWQGGPTPAGSQTGVYPYKSDNGSASPYNGCGVGRQTLPSADYLARAQWVGNCPSPITTPAGYSVQDPTSFLALTDDFVPGSNCGSGGWVETIGMYGRLDSIWQAGSVNWHSPMGIFTHDLTPRIQSWSPLRAWDQANANAVNGTDEHPLTLIFLLSDSGSAANPRAWVNNAYVELNLDDEHAPTDYIWRGDRNTPYPGTECCPQGPYPIICQQVREVNAGNYEQATDLQYLQDHCPSLVPPYNPQTGTGKTWSAIAFGFLAVMCKDPCTCEEQGSGSHRPTMNHPALFDGNVWRELRSNRGNALAQCPPGWGAGPPWDVLGPETTMQDSGGGSCGNFSLAGGTHAVYVKLTTNKILIWMHNSNGDYCGAFDRVYKGPFNRVAMGVGPGCELKDKLTQGDDYACKPGGTPTQCLTYSSGTADGYWRDLADAINLLDGALVKNTNLGACCKPADGTCDVMTQADCSAAGGDFRGKGTLCDASTCVGACCKANGTCVETLPNACPGGTFQGAGSHCATANCPCPNPFADADADGDVDQIDFARFQLCFTGNSTADFDPINCKCFDRNNDQMVNQDDFTAFQACWSGPSVPANTACDGAP